MNTRMAILVLSLVLSACAAIESNPAVATLGHALGSKGGVENAPLNPKFSYLRFTLNGRPAILALGFVERHSGDPVEVWYGADRQALRLQNGRLLGIVGFSEEWRNVSIPALPSWTELLHADQPIKWIRTRDVMPGYHFGIQDTLTLRRIDPPAHSELWGLNPVSLIWFEEQEQGRALPPARYAVSETDGNATLIYAEQCLSPDMCLTWQQWPVARNAPSAAAGKQ